MSNDDLVEQLEIDLDASADPVRSILKSPQSPPAGDPDYNLAPSKNARVVLQRAPRGESSTGTGAGTSEGTGEGTSEGTGTADDPGDAAQRAGEQRQLRLLTWGLVPSWASDPGVGARMTNARAETVAQKPAFRAALGARRALVPADGWYEWQVSPVATDARGTPRKQPFFMHRTDGVPVTFAGLYEFWRDPACERDDPLAWLTTFTILTTAAEPGLARIHDRQPVVLDPDRWDAWLDRRTGPDEIAGMLAAQRPGRFAAYPIARAVGNSRANGPALLEPLTDPAQLAGVVDPQTGEVLP